MADKEDFGSFLERMRVSNKVGSCEFFDVKPFIDAANILAAAEEPMRALKLLDNLPSFYRDYIPPEVKALKNKILSTIATPSFYQTNCKDMMISEENAIEMVGKYFRGHEILKDVVQFNKEGKFPHIVDYGPGDYWLPLGLKAAGCKFTYKDIGLHDKARTKALELLSGGEDVSTPEKNAPTIFVACEIIEHLHYEKEILIEYNRLALDAQVIHISTPLYTFDGRQERLVWDSWDVSQHLRTYTPREFFNLVDEMWPGYKWDSRGGNVMHLRGVKS